MKIYASMKSIASFVPSNCIKNDDFLGMIETSDEWITKRTGIKTRYFANKNELTSDLGFKAAEVAIERANIDTDEIDLILCATLTPDFLCMPSTAAVISRKLGIKNKPALDISAACTGFVYALSLAKAYIESGMYKNILVVGAEKLSSIVDFSDRGTCILFGDGAGATIIGQTQDKNKSIIDVNINANGDYGDLLLAKRRADGDFFSAKNKVALENEGQFVHMKGNEIFKLAVKMLSTNAAETLARNDTTAEQIDFFVPHQANLRIINAAGEALKMKKEKIVLTVQKYGNTSSASIPMALDDIYREGRLKNGDLMLFSAFGGGLTWGSCLLHFNGA